MFRPLPIFAVAAIAWFGIGLFLAIHDLNAMAAPRAWDFVLLCTMPALELPLAVLAFLNRRWAQYGYIAAFFVGLPCRLSAMTVYMDGATEIGPVIAFGIAMTAIIVGTLSRVLVSPRGDAVLGEEPQPSGN